MTLVLNTIILPTLRLDPSLRPLIPEEVHHTCKHVSILLIQSRRDTKHTRKHDQQNTTTRSQSQHLWQESLVQRTEPLLPEHRSQRRPRPIVLRHAARNLWRILYPRLDHIHRRVQHRTDCASNASTQQIIPYLLALVLRLGQQRLHLEDTAKVSRVPQNVAPRRGFQPIVQCQRSLCSDGFLHTVDEAVVFVSLRFVLHANLDEFEGDDDEGFGCSGGGAGEDGEGLVHFGDAKCVAVEFAPFVVGGEFCGSGGVVMVSGKRWRLWRDIGRTSWALP